MVDVLDHLGGQATGRMDGMRNFLIAIAITIVLEVGVVVLTVQFVDIIWLRAVIIAIVPIAFLLAAIFMEGE